jgi:predicted phosphoribosyltransferase
VPCSSLIALMRGQRLAARLEHLRGEPVVVLGLPRGGVPVALEVAGALGAPLDVIVVRKLGVPFQPELGMGAVGDLDQIGDRRRSGGPVRAAVAGAAERSAAPAGIPGNKTARRDQQQLDSVPVCRGEAGAQAGHGAPVRRLPQEPGR